MLVNNEKLKPIRYRHLNIIYVDIVLYESYSKQLNKLNKTRQ
jgi:hypothetical protein